MTIVEEVQSFARNYINLKEYRTSDRKLKIRQALSYLTGEKINFGCSTCYIEALFRIIKITKMATSKYELKKGVVLQAFGDSSKTCTNNTITDELGDWYLANHPEKLIYFVRYPNRSSVVIPPIVNKAVTVIPPTKIEVPDPQAMVSDALGAADPVTTTAKSPNKRSHKAKK
jgi:hypothetical protein